VDSTRVNEQAEPFAILSVDHAGSFSTFSPELLGLSSARYGDFRFGNVWSDPIRAVQQQPRFEQIVSEINEGILRCNRECDYFTVCGGGAPVNKLAEQGSFSATETIYCRLTCQAVTRAVLDWSEGKPVRFHG
jgi:uncharacterized protein